MKDCLWVVSLKRKKKKQKTKKTSFLVKCVCAESLSHLWLYATPGSFVHGNSPGKTTGVDGHAFLQGIFTTQGSNPGPPHCRWILYCLSHHEAPVLSKQSLTSCVIFIRCLIITQNLVFSILRVRFCSELYNYIFENVNH